MKDFLREAFAVPQCPQKGFPFAGQSLQNYRQTGGLPETGHRRRIKNERMYAMQYNNITDGVFRSRPNRFIAHVEIDGTLQTVHVKNTGRCRELLLPGASVRLEKSDNPARKTEYDLVAVHKPGLGWVNIDSQAPNRVVLEWLGTQGYDTVRPEYPYGNSRIDFYMEKNGERHLMEVKGCTLEQGGIGYFPDAPTRRGTKHLQELAGAQRAGWHCTAAFVVQMPCISQVRPNTRTDPAFAAAWQQARQAGVEILFLLCRVGRDSLRITGQSRPE